MPTLNVRPLRMRQICLTCLLMGIVFLTSGQLAPAQERPNIVVLLADDMGFGEVQHLNPERGKIPTPSLDAIAQGGMVFTDGHSGSSVCTPTRYGLLTGRYAWRTRLQRGVLTGGESLIAEDRLTLPKMLKQQGYHTACIGKWHLGMFYDGENNGKKGVPVGAKITHGPIDRGGFDKFYGFHHARQMDVWIEDDVVTERIEAVDMLPRLTQQAVSYIDSRVGNEQPFFLYVPWNSPHSPVVPSAEWKGKSGLNDHADFVMQTDDSFGQVVAALKKNGFLNNTLVICSSDNGTSGPTSKIKELNELGHFPSGELRGSKADIWDGGHRVPFLAHWPDKINPGSECEKLVCLNDLFATAAEISEFKIPENAAEDSFSFLPLLLGGTKPTRRNVIHHSVSGHFAIRSGNWKLIVAHGSGGWSAPKEAAAVKASLPRLQLYNMKSDVSERSNWYPTQGERASQMMELLQTQVDNGRSTPGKAQANDAQVVIEKAAKKNK